MKGFLLKLDEKTLSPFFKSTPPTNSSPSFIKKNSSPPLLYRRRGSGNYGFIHRNKYPPLHFVLLPPPPITLRAILWSSPYVILLWPVYENFRNVKNVVFISFTSLTIKWIIRKYKQIETRIMVDYLTIIYIVYIHIYIYIYIYMT